MKNVKTIQALIVTCLIAFTGSSMAGKPVGITPDMMDVSVIHNGKTVMIKRDQNNKAVVNPAFAKTSRPCPPFCIQPIVLTPGVDPGSDNCQAVNYGYYNKLSQKAMCTAHGFLLS